jgi:hypothetical protein
MGSAVIISLLLALSAAPALAQVDVKLDETNSKTLPLPAPGGWVLSSDGETLIVSSPKTAEIIYINTSEEKEVKRVKVKFQPAALALRGSSLYAVAKGSSLIYVLDAQTGQSKEQIRVPGETLVQLACHPSAGPLFATNDQFEVLALKMGTSKLEKTEAQGSFLAVAPKGDFLYADLLSFRVERRCRQVSWPRRISSPVGRGSGPAGSALLDPTRAQRRSKGRACQVLLCSKGLRTPF